MTTSAGVTEPLLEDGLRRAVEDFGCDPPNEPERTAAIVADLVGRPGRSVASEIAALRTALITLEAHREGASVDRVHWEAAVAAEGFEQHAWRAAVGACIAVLQIEPAQEQREATTSSRVLLGGLAAAASVVALVAVLVITGGDAGVDDTASLPQTDNQDAEGSPSAEASTSSTEATESAVAIDAGISAQFAPTEVGPVVVQRGWRVTPGGRELVGIIFISNPADSAVSISHRELPPPSVVTDASQLEWSPEPDGMANTTAVYQLVIDGGATVELMFRNPLDPNLQPTEAMVLDWFEVWKPRAEQIQPLLADIEPILAPTIEVES